MFSPAEDTTQYLIRLETAVDPLSLLNWLENQTSDTKIYWACRQEDLEIAAVGFVDSVDTTNTSSFEQAISTVEASLKKSCPQIRYYGGRCFDLKNIDLSAWEGFGQYRFIVPEYEIIRKEDHYSLARNVRTDCGVDIEQIRERFREFVDHSLRQTDSSLKTDSEEKPTCGLSRQDIPCQSEWISLAGQLLDAIQAGEIEKIVLAQKMDLTAESPFNPVSLFRHIKSRSPQTYTFLYQFPGSGLFLGASPECLFKKDGQDIYSEAIAGTRPMTPHPEMNLHYQKELSRSAKEVQEHDYVAGNIQAALEGICKEVCCTHRHDILRTSSVQHLCTRFRGKLLASTNIYHILNALHPTAAVNGTPSGKAIELIRSVEPFSRGWYAGAIGWMMSEQAEFAVAIRSALVQQSRTISIYSGAGIVKDSDPQREWEETELKKRLILDAIKEIV